MKEKDFSLQIGSLLFTGQSIRYIVLGIFLMGFLAGLYATIHIENPQIPVSLTVLPLFAASLLPLYFIKKGIRKTKGISSK